MALSLLNSVEELDGDWIRTALSQTYPDIPDIVAIAHRPIGNGNANETYRVTLDYVAPPRDAPASVVLKMQSSIPETAQASADVGGYLCEHEMTRILPQVSNLRAPRFYHSGISDDRLQTAILMEDLSDRCEAGDQMAGASAAQAVAAVKELMRVHKHFWNSTQLDTFDWTVAPMPYHHPGQGVIKERLGAKLTEEQIQILDESMPYIDAWLEDQPINCTLIHGDCRVDNILFDMTETQYPEAYIIDWANCRVGDAMSDVAYLLASSVKVVDRRACEQQAIALYANEMAQIQPDYSIEQATEDYRRNITSSMFLTLLAAAFIPQTPHTDLLLETLIRRNCAAHKDWLFS